MDLFWKHGPMFVKELLEFYPDPKPHFNTVSTQVRILEICGFLKHESFGKSYRYEPIISEREYGRRSLAGIVKDYFDNSYMSAVSAFVKEKKISADELRELIDMIESDK